MKEIHNVEQYLDDLEGLLNAEFMEKVEREMQYRRGIWGRFLAWFYDGVVGTATFTYWWRRRKIK